MGNSSPVSCELTTQSLQADQVLSSYIEVRTLFLQHSIFLKIVAHRCSLGKTLLNFTGQVMKVIRWRIN